MPQKKSLILSTLFLVLFIDGLGQGILYPVLTRALINPHATTLGTFSSEEVRYVLYGLAVGIFFIGRFFGGAFLGDMSDSLGRKKTLAICLLGTFVGYFLCALAFYFHMISLLLIGRVIDGFTAGNQPIAQASVLDFATEERKSQYVGWVMAAVTIGIILGPLVGGVFSESSWVSWFSNSTPMYVAMLLSLLALLILSWKFVDTAEVKQGAKIRFLRVFTIFVEAFKDARVRFVSIAFFLMHLGWCVYFLYAAAYVAHHYSFSPMQVSWYVAAIGVGLSIGLAILPKFFRKVKNQKAIVLFGYAVLGISVLLIGLIPSTALLWALVVPAGACVGLAYASFMPIFSAQTTPERKGWIMGLAGSLVALAAALGPLISGWLDTFGATLPLLVAAVIAFVGCGLFASFRVKP
jgi:MFS family permease